jgi:hypothetical protein
VPSNRLRRGAPLDDQLSLPLAWLSEAEFLRAMHARGIVGLRRIRFKDNRTRMLSLSGDRSTLHVQSCFRAAPSDVLDAIAAFAGAARDSVGYRRAVRRMRAWWDGQVGEAGAGPCDRTCCGTPEQRAFLRGLYASLNVARFGGRLPADVPLRLSERMSRRFGHVEYGPARADVRTVAELAINVNLLLPGNERHLLDTVLHEMAHVEAWVVHGHRGHGTVWRRIASRVGCEPRACTDVRLRRRRRRGERVVHVPALAGPAVPTRT